MHGRISLSSAITPLNAFTHVNFASDSTVRTAPQVETDTKYGNCTGHRVPRAPGGAPGTRSYEPSGNSSFGHEVPEYPLFGHGQTRAIATAGRAAPWKIASGCRMTGRHCKARKVWM